MTFTVSLGTDAPTPPPADEDVEAQGGSSGFANTANGLLRAGAGALLSLLSLALKMPTFQSRRLGSVGTAEVGPLFSEMRSCL